MRTRRISISAATGFGIEHSVQVIIMVSKIAPAKGSCSADALISETGRRASAILFLAIWSSSIEGSIA
jgi:hypothetical protein